MIWRVAKHFMTALNRKADCGFKSSFPSYCITEEDIYSFYCDVEWVMSWGCQYSSIDYEFSILIHSLDFMHLSNQNADSELLLLCSKWHFQRHDLTYAKGPSWRQSWQRNVPNETAHKKRMFCSKSPSPATSSQNLQVAAVQLSWNIHCEFFSLWLALWLKCLSIK